MSEMNLEINSEPAEESVTSGSTPLAAAAAAASAAPGGAPSPSRPTGVEHALDFGLEAIAAAGLESELEQAAVAAALRLDPSVCNHTM